MSPALHDAFQPLRDLRPFRSVTVEAVGERTTRTEGRTMRMLIVYGSTEGHTRDLCHYSARVLGEAGYPTAVEPAGSDMSKPDPTPYDAVILAASLHVGRYQAPLIAYARAHREMLGDKPSAFISVSLSAAGINPHDWEGCEECLAKFEHETQWTPKAVHHAAGAIRYSQYDFFKRLALKFIVAQRGQSTVTSRDYDLTDYEALGKFVTTFAAGAQPAA
jgi:menaquinone-dependent protoporphyrinogen oxidase